MGLGREGVSPPADSREVMQDAMLAMQAPSPMLFGALAPGVKSVDAASVCIQRLLEALSQATDVVASEYSSGGGAACTRML